ncbi:ArnT family glycosyltransferase [Mucilaginibacter sp.]
MSFQKRVFLLIIASAILKLFFSTTTGLGADEVYYWTYALKLQWNYFDHPPLVAWLIRLTTGNLFFHNEVSVRLGAIICSSICIWLIFKLGALMNNLQTGWFAALLYTASVYCSITAGTNILPDSPQMIFWLTSIILLIKISRITNDNPKVNLLWCLFGLSTGLCMMSKVHGVFIWIGALLYVLFINRNWLKNWGIYLAILISLIIVSPIIIWNFQNDFITYKFHSSRINPIGSGLDLLGFIKNVFGQMASNNPISFVLIYISLLSVFKGKIPVEKKEIKILLFCSIPLIALMLFISLFKDTHPYWPGPAYSSLLILPAAQLAANAKSKKQIIPGVLKWALAYLVIIAFLQILVTNHFPGTLSLQKQGPKTGLDDLTLDSYGWREAGNSFDSLYQSDVAKNIMPANAPIVITNWDTGAAIEFYVAHKTKQQVIGIGDILDLHQYYWANKYKKQLKAGDSAYFIVASDGFNYRTSNLVNQCFKQYDKPFVITQYRSGLICRYISVYRMRGYLNGSSITKATP